MSESFFFLLLCAIVLLAIAAKHLNVAYPIIFVIGGILLAIIPGVPTITLKPDWVFLLFLPPLLFGDGWTTDVRQFMRYLQPIALLAIGLVIATTLAVAAVAHQILGLSLGVSFVLGAILSPTDAVATDAIAEKLPFPRRLATIISGESLVNDAMGLVLYRFGVAAVMAGTFSFATISLQFIYVAVAGVGIGITLAHLVFLFQIWLNRERLSDELISVAISLVTPFLIYVPADAVGASGVLAVVAGGMYLSQKSSRMFDPATRLAAAGVWNLLFFTLNGAAFILIGLQLRSILHGLSDYSPKMLFTYGLIITLTVVGTRFAWIFPVARLRFIINPRLAQREGPAPTWQSLFILSWAGMRGIVSLAAVLALPAAMPGGKAFPERELLLFVTFTVILVSLLIQGITLPHLIARLFKRSDHEPEEMSARARVRAADSGLQRLISLEAGFESTAHWQVAGRLRAQYEQRLNHYRAHLDGMDPVEDALEHDIDRNIRRELYTAERVALAQMRHQGEITDDIFRRLEREIDLAESKLSP